MYKLLTRFLIIVLALVIAARVVPGIHIDDLYTAALVTVVLGLMNLIVRPILVILTLPITILTMGLFVLVLNAGLFWFVGSFVEGFSVDGFIPAVLGSIIVSFASGFAHKVA